jgi:hypothetical protein
MSFFETMKRLAQGKPPYEPEAAIEKGDLRHDPNPAAPVDPPQHATDTPTGEKVLPRVTLEEAKCYVNGDRLECYTMIYNESTYDVTLDKIMLLNMRRELDATLRAGQKREFLVYSGPVPDNQNYNNAELQFKDNMSDYFVSHHDVFFDAHDDKYVIHRFHFSGLSDR